jgi:hypothetical protein
LVIPEAQSADPESRQLHFLCFWIPGSSLRDGPE